MRADQFLDGAAVFVFRGSAAYDAEIGQGLIREFFLLTSQHHSYQPLGKRLDVAEDGK